MHPRRHRGSSRFRKYGVVSLIVSAFFVLLALLNIGLFISILCWGSVVLFGFTGVAVIIRYRVHHKHRYHSRGIRFGRFGFFGLGLAVLLFASVFVYLYGPDLFAVGIPNPLPTPTPVPTVTPYPGGGDPTPTPYPTPTPTPFPYSGTNLAPSPYGWGDYPIYGRVVHSADPQDIFLDTTMLSPSGNPTIRFDPHVNGVDHNIFRSVNVNSYIAGVTNNGFIPCNPGDHIYFSAWIKTGSAVNGNYYLHGGIIMFDFYGIKDSDGSWGQLFECHRSDQAQFTGFAPFPDSQVVHYGSDWTQVAIDVIVPSHISSPDSYNTGVPTCFIPEMGAYPRGPTADNSSLNEQGIVWIGDTVVYVTAE